MEYLFTKLIFTSFSKLGRQELFEVYVMHTSNCLEKYYCFQNVCSNYNYAECTFHLLRMISERVCGLNVLTNKLCNKAIVLVYLTGLFSFKS